jgi:predicted MPP superfamily phosphohydrolase
LKTTDFSTFSNFDIIGDIHGYGTALEILLEKMGYSENEPYNYTHPEDRKVLFIGDYIDRGEEILKTLRIVRTMHENGNAIAIMGNHEFNFLCYHYTDEHGKSFRSMDKKTHGERKTDSELVDEKNSYLNWMSELPLTFENEYLRAVHAHWDKKSIALIQERGVHKLDRDGLLAIHADEELLQAYEIVLKGDELEIDEEYRFPDKE